MTARVYDPNGASPTVRTCAGGNLEPKIAEPHSGISPTLTTRPEGFKTAILPVEERQIEVGKQIRVRKLTEREAGRLMGVKDEDIDRIAQHQSKSSQYHLYGDSICVPVLMAIFAPMFGKTLTEEHINEIYKGESANV